MLRQIASGGGRSRRGGLGGRNWTLSAFGRDRSRPQPAIFPSATGVVGSGVCTNFADHLDYQAQFDRWLLAKHRRVFAGGLCFTDPAHQAALDERRGARKRPKRELLGGGAQPKPP